MMWFLAREVLRIRGIVARDVEWEACVDLFFARDADEIEKTKEEEAKAAQAQAEGEATEVAEAEVENNNVVESAW